MVAAGLGVSINNELVSENWKEDVVTRPFVPEEKITLGIASRPSGRLPLP